MRARAQFIGRLTKDPEKKDIGGTTLTTFSLACNFKTKEGKKADFFDFEAWRQAGDYISEYAKKGDLVVVQADLRNDKFTDKQGNERKKVKNIVVPMSFEFLASAGNQSGIDAEGVEAKSSPKATATDIAIDPDEAPF